MMPSTSNTTPAIPSPVAQSYLETLLSGERVACRQLIEDAQTGGLEPYDLLTKLVWPTMELLQQLYREDRISISSLNLGTRLNRLMTDQLCARLVRKPENGRSVLIFCGDDEPEELGGQICADLFEADGWTGTIWSEAFINRAFLLGALPILRYVIGVLLVDTRGSVLASAMLHASFNASGLVRGARRLAIRADTGHSLGPGDGVPTTVRPVTGRRPRRRRHCPHLVPQLRPERHVFTREEHTR